jgi:glutamate synthase domain-containing protein 3
MAELGFRRFDDLVGRVDKLRARNNVSNWKANCLDLSALLAHPAAPLQARAPTRGVPHHGAIRQVEEQNHYLREALDHDLMDMSRAALELRQQVHLGCDGTPLPLRNTQVSVGAMLAGEIARRHGAKGLPADCLKIDFRGTAGQSFGAWCPPGVTLVLEGETNDYVGKGLSGGRIVVRPPERAGYDPERTIVVGNVALYGATGGEAFFRGIAGERFAVRNSGALTVVEGVGDHGCEYMTGGVVVVLGPTGRNFAAGMSGGTAFVLDVWGRFRESCNTEMVGLEQLEDPDDIALLRRLLKRHGEWTHSVVARRVLDNWTEYVSRFVKVMPHDLRSALEQRSSLTDTEVPCYTEAAV